MKITITAPRASMDEYLDEVVRQREQGFTSGHVDATTWWESETGDEAPADEAQADYRDDDLVKEGYYLITYGRKVAPQGPFTTVRALAHDRGLMEYPADGYIVWSDSVRTSTVPSVNPDDLVQPRPPRLHR